MILCEKNDKLWNVYLEAPSILVIFFSDKEITADKNGVGMSRSERHNDKVLYENLNKYNFSSLFIDELVFDIFGTMISLKIDLKNFLFIKGSKPMNVSSKWW